MRPRRRRARVSLILPFQDWGVDFIGEQWGRRQRGLFDALALLEDQGFSCDRLERILPPEVATFSVFTEIGPTACSLRFTRRPTVPSVIHSTKPLHDE
jgi:hypothetical protein